MVVLSTGSTKSVHVAVTHWRHSNQSRSRRYILRDSFWGMHRRSFWIGCLWRRRRSPPRQLPVVQWKYSRPRPVETRGKWRLRHECGHSRRVIPRQCGLSPGAPEAARAPTESPSRTRRVPVLPLSAIVEPSDAQPIVATYVGVNPSQPTY